MLSQDARKFSKLAAGCNLDDSATVAPPANNMVSYDEAIANSCTDSYMVGAAVAKAQGTSPISDGSSLMHQQMTALSWNALHAAISVHVFLSTDLDLLCISADKDAVIVTG